MITVKTNLENGVSEIIETRSLPPNTVCKFMDTIREAREELDLRNQYAKGDGKLLALYMKQYGWDF